MTNDTEVLLREVNRDGTIRAIRELRTKLDEFEGELGGTGGGSEQPVTPQELKAVIGARRKRESMFPDGLFADPAWDMLLELYYAAKTQQRLAVSVLCTKSAIPQSTALRWINKLEESALVVRLPDPFDSRRVFVELSAEAAGTLDHYFSSLNATIRAV